MATRIEIMPNDPTYLFWAGDGTKNDANAIFYIKNNGSAYFGGSLTAGQLIASAESNQIGSAATISTGKFGTNGGSKTVYYSLNYRNIGMFNSSFGNGTNQATLNLYRSLSGGPFVFMQSHVVTGTYTSEYDGELMLYNINSNISGGGTFIDTSTHTGSFEYYTTITSASGQWPVTLGGPPWSQGNQTLRISSSE